MSALTTQEPRTPRGRPGAPPIEERLRIATVYCVALERITALAEDPAAAALFTSTHSYERWVRELAAALGAELRAIQTAMPMKIATLATRGGGR